MLVAVGLTTVVLFADLSVEVALAFIGLALNFGAAFLALAACFTAAARTVPVAEAPVVGTVAARAALPLNIPASAAIVAALRIIFLFMVCNVCV